MSAASRRQVLSAIRTDSASVVVGNRIETRCLHCRSRVAVSADGELLGNATLEHIIPRSWFGRSGAAGFTRDLTGPDDPRNLAIACARCNHDKGVAHDQKGPGDARAREVIAALAAKRASRWREEEA